MRLLPAMLVTLVLLPAVLAVYPGDPGFRGCVMLTVDGQFQDSDCDKIPEQLDNCPLIANPVQGDVDRNGIGDACDLVIDQVFLEPEEPLQGRSALVRASIFNNRPYPMRNMVVKVEVPRLGTVVSQPLQVIEPGQRVLQELLFRVPECAPPVKTDVVVIVEYPFAPGQREVFSSAVRAPVQESGNCPLDPGDELTVVDIIELQDVHPEFGAVYPFTIKNNWPESKAYILTVQGMESWGVAEIQPGSVIVVPSGSAREGAVHVWAYAGQEGKKSFTLSVNARDDAKQVLLQADIPPPPTPVRGKAGSQLLIGVLTFLAVLVLIGLVLLFMQHKDKETLHKQLEKTQKVEKPKKAVKKTTKKKKK